MKPACERCAHWNRLSFYRGQCLRAPVRFSRWRDVGNLDHVDSFEETRPDYWCIDFEAVTDDQDQPRTEDARL